MPFQPELHQNYYPKLIANYYYTLTASVTHPEEVPLGC